MTGYVFCLLGDKYRKMNLKFYDVFTKFQLTLHKK